MSTDQPPEGESGPGREQPAPGRRRGPPDAASAASEQGYRSSPVPPDGTDRFPTAPYGRDVGSRPHRERGAEGPPLASRARRLVARIVDALLIGVPVLLVFWPLPGGGQAEGTAGAVGQQVVFVLAYLGYEGLMLTSSGQTVGKKLMRIRVAVLETGGVPQGRQGWSRAGIYSLPLLVPFFGTLFWLVNVAFCLWDQPWRQCLHDKPPGTVVVTAD